MWLVHSAQQDQQPPLQSPVLRLSPAATGGTMLPWNDLPLQLSCASSRIRAGSCITDLVQLPRNLPGTDVLVCSGGSVFLSTPFLPVVPAARNVQPCTAALGEALPVQQNGQGLGNSSLLTCSGSSVAFPWQPPQVLSQYTVPAVG